MKLIALYENIKLAPPLDSSSRVIKPKKYPPLNDRQKFGFDRLKYQAMVSKCSSCGGMRFKHKADCQADK